MVYEPKMIGVLEEHTKFLTWGQYRMDVEAKCCKKIRPKCWPVSADPECLDCYGCSGGQPACLAQYITEETDGTM